MSEQSLRDALETISRGGVPFGTSPAQWATDWLAAHPVEPATDGHSWSNGVHYPPTGGAHVVERCQSGCPAEPAGVSDEAVKAAVIAAGNTLLHGDRGSQMRAALEAAAPFIQPQVVAFREAVEQVVAEYIDDLDNVPAMGTSADHLDRRAKHVTDGLLAAGVFREPPTLDEINHALSLHWWDEDDQPCVCGFDFIAAGQSFKMHLADVVNLLGGATGINSTLYTCPGCGATVIGHETCGDPTRPECAGK